MGKSNGVSSKRFEVAQGRRQGCVLSPMLINVFFAVKLLVAQQRFSEDANTFMDIAHLQEHPAKVGPQTALEFARRSMWGMLYADDACIVPQSLRGLELMMSVFEVSVFRCDYP